MAKQDGNKILGKFSRPLNIVDGQFVNPYSSDPLACKATFQKYTYVPGGTLEDGEATVQSLEIYKTIDNVSIDISGGTQTNTEYTNEHIRLAEKPMEDEEVDEDG